MGSRPHVICAQVEQRVVAKAEFEVRTTKRIVGNLVQQRFEALKARQEANLNQRRQRLAEKLDAEDAALREELLASRKTPEQRRADLAARARALAERREAERQALATQLLEQSFIRGCDVLRGENSKRLLYRTVEERNAQVSAFTGSRTCRTWGQAARTMRPARCRGLGTWPSVGLYGCARSSPSHGCGQQVLPRLR
jgi:hypothetical protein